MCGKSRETQAKKWLNSPDVQAIQPEGEHRAHMEKLWLTLVPNGKQQPVGRGSCLAASCSQVNLL